VVVVIALVGAVYYLLAGRAKTFVPVVAPAPDDPPLPAPALRHRRLSAAGRQRRSPAGYRLPSPAGYRRPVVSAGHPPVIGCRSSAR
jgi:hypothetical protein